MPHKRLKLTWRHSGKHLQIHPCMFLSSPVYSFSPSLSNLSLSLSFYLASFAPLSLSLPPDRSSAPTPPRATSGSQQLNPAASALRRPQVLAEPREAPAGLEPPAQAAAMSASLPPPWAWAWSAVTSEGDPDPESPR